MTRIIDTYETDLKNGYFIGTVKVTHGTIVRRIDTPKVKGKEALERAFKAIPEYQTQPQFLPNL
jgi:hypothetical protein